jgi:hypothetical protein
MFQKCEIALSENRRKLEKGLTTGKQFVKISISCAFPTIFATSVILHSQLCQSEMDPALHQSQPTYPLETMQSER